MNSDEDHGVPLTGAIVQELKAGGFRFYVQMPCSEHRPLFTACHADPFFRVITACHEGDAVTIGCGLSVAGQKCIVAIENAGLFQAGEALRAMSIDMQIPLVVLIGNQGVLGPTPNVSPEQALQDMQSRSGGAATHGLQQRQLAPKMLEMLNIPYALMADGRGAPLLHWAEKKSREIQGPVALFHGELQEVTK